MEKIFFFAEIVFEFFRTNFGQNIISMDSTDHILMLVSSEGVYVGVDGRGWTWVDVENSNI